MKPNHLQDLVEWISLCAPGTEAAMLKYFKIAELADLPESRRGEAVQILQRKAEKHALSMEEIEGNPVFEPRE